VERGDADMAERGSKRKKKEEKPLTINKCQRRRWRQHERQTLNGLENGRIASRYERPRVHIDTQNRFGREIFVD